MYLSNNFFLISRLLPTHSTKLQFFSLVISRNLPIPMPEYAIISQVKQCGDQIAAVGAI